MSAKEIGALLQTARKDAGLEERDRRLLTALAAAFSSRDAAPIKDRLALLGGPRPSCAPELAQLARALAKLRRQRKLQIDKMLEQELGILVRAARASSADSVLEFVDSLRTALSVARASPKKAQRARGKPLNRDLVALYVRRLEETLRDADAFPVTLSALGADSAIRRAELVAIADAFYGPTPASTSRADCLKLIGSRHKAIMRLRSKLRTQSGKSAA